MSTVHSTPPTTATGNRSHPFGFNDQTYDDPFFASAPTDEGLVPIESDHSPSHPSCHTPSPPRSSYHNSVSPAEDSNYLHPSSQTDLVGALHPSHLPDLNDDYEAAGPAYDFLSPIVYMSDAGYIASSEHTTTPDFGGDGFHLDDGYSMMPFLQEDHTNDLSNDHPQQSQDTAESSDCRHPVPARPSAGTATLASHLMSPVLTDSGVPSSRRGTNSPPERICIKDEEQDKMDMGSFVNNQRPSGLASGLTPSVTESSKGTSPDSSFVVPDIARAASPIIRVDGYSRGDSPARGPALSQRPGRKRSRAGSDMSHLTVQQHQHTGDGARSNDYFGSTHTFSEQPGARSGLDPEARSHVSSLETSNLREQEIQTQVAMKNIDVEEWLDRSEPGSKDQVDAPPLKPSAVNQRQRAKSAGAQTLSHANLESLKYAKVDSHIPGPGVLIDEDSGEDEDYNEDGSASIEKSSPSVTALGEAVNEIPGDANVGEYDEIPNQPPLYRAKLWQDPLYDSSNPGIKMQPETANAAIMRYQQRAGDIETLSRVATWGTRRLSESDLTGLFHRFSFTDKPQGPVKGKRERRGSFLQQLSRGISSKKSSSNLRRQDSDKSIKSKEKPSRSPPHEHNRKESEGSRKGSLGVPQTAQSGLKKMSSLSKKPKSPRINTGNAVAAMAVQASALGAGGSVSATGTSSPTAWPRNIIRRPRSRSDLNKASSQDPIPSSVAEWEPPGLTEMWTKQGGPPMPALATPFKHEETLPSAVDVEDDEDDDGGEDHGITMDLAIRSDPIIPTLEGFKSNIRDLNPRLPSFMFDRIAQEQLRRFKKLMDFKIKHAQALSIGQCPSGKHCAELGGEPTYLPSKSGGREPELNHSGFSIAGFPHSDEDANALAEGLVTPAQFPPGVPLPPVKRLPAEFECSICFKVKKFNKPSDWSKHVHEDVQPFTCTFVNCAEPKSFKRKADWVRHENERHRQLEWWTCNMSECSHKCFRKDNFVQHLVREHKLPEPKIKTTKTGKPAVRGPSSQKARNRHGEDREDMNDEIDSVWQLVDQCRHETPKYPKDEACKFCGNICNSWKKLTVHLAKHMEQISMPVLDVVKQKEVTPDTIISPIEQRMASQQNSMSPLVQSPFSQTGQINSIPPYGAHSSQGGEVPNAFSSFQPQSSYMGSVAAHQQPLNLQRASPNTYPPPGHTQQMNTNYSQISGQNPYASGYSSYAESPAPNMRSVGNTAGFLPHPTSSPENIYSGNIRAPTSQPRSSYFDSNEAFQYVPHQSQSQPGTMEGNGFPMANRVNQSYHQPTAPPIPQHDPVSSYSQQPASVQGRMPIPYMQVGQMHDFARTTEFSPTHVLQQQHQQYPYSQ